MRKFIDPLILDRANNRRLSISSLFVALLAGASNPARAATVYYVDIVNTAASSIRSFEVARSGSDRFHPVLLGDAPLQGGGASATIAIRQGDDDSCKRDLRVHFADGRVVTHRDFNICKYRSYHSGRYLRERNQTAAVALP
jgi:hypothetical protein